uniref:Pentatricopeptide repeat-containing protein-mitochondrial domain-containing protein n=1 Tax=Rhodosorus marinus TaxID=101924 RepID=A0A7S3A1T5_9RHOD|mmetsp:Transcript_41672/g.163618  ORF Transcript_41672/g.163618 Transcript_41672/m.163618 type:complete len:682 (+) Transcript_41672:358-2403(+)
MWRAYRSSVRLKPPDGVRFLSDHVRRLPPVFSNSRGTELVYRLTRHWKAEKIVPSSEYLRPLLERWARAKKTRHILTVMRYMDLAGALFSPALYLNLIRAHCECGEIVKGLYYYHEMCFTGIRPSAEIFIYLFRVLGENQKFAEAKWLWEDVKAKGLSLDRELYASFAFVLFVERGFSAITKLLNSSAGESDFDEGDFMNSLIVVLNEKSEVQMAEMLLRELADRDLRPDSKALASFVDAYMRDGKTLEAREILRAQEENSMLGIESYNGLMRGLLTTGQCERLKEVFATIETVEDVTADRESFVLLMSALARIDDHTGLMQAFEKFKSREFELCDEVSDMIIHSQIGAGKVKQAAKLFLDEFAAQRCCVYRATQASLLEGLVSIGEHALAVDVFENLQALGEDSFTQVTNAQMVAAYYSQGDSLSAGHLMSVIVETTVPSRDWPKLSCGARNSILRAQNYIDPEGTKKMYSEFKKLGCSMNEATHAIVINSFGKTRNMRSLEDVHQEMRSGRVKYTEITAEAMADAFVEMGEVTKALSVLEEAAGDGLKPRLKSYTEVILYFARNDVGSMCRAIQNLCAKGVPPSLDIFEIAIRSLANRGHDASAHGVYKMVKDAGATPNREILEDLVSMCARLGKVQDALFYFDELIAHDIVPSSRSLNWILNGLARGIASLPLKILTS